MQKRSLLRLLASFMLPGAGSLLAGCGGTQHGDPADAPAPSVPPALPPRTFAYVANFDSADISVYEVEASGALKPLGSVPAGAGTSSVAFHPSGRFAYAANSGVDFVSVYDVDAETGMLTPKDPFAGGHRTRAVRIHPSGNFAYVISDDDNTFSVCSLDPDTGMLETIEHILVGIDRNAADIAVDPMGQFVFVAQAGGGVASYAVEHDGRLRLVGAVGAAASPQAAAVAPSGKFLYVALGNGQLAVHPIAAGLGAVGARTHADAGTAASSIVTEASGRFAYAATSDLAQHRISAFTIIPDTGALDWGSGRDRNTGVAISSLAISPSGQFVFRTSSDDNTVVPYTVDQDTGALMLDIGDAAATGENPVAMTVVNLTQ